MSYQQNQSRRFLPPGGNRKRKGRDESEPKKAPAPPFNGFKPPAPKPPKPPTAFSSQKTTASPMSSNRLLAGYMAHEYLTKGSLFGQKIDGRVPMNNADARRGGKAAADGKDTADGAAEERYEAVAGILMTEGAHIPGIVNPSQLGKWIQKQM